MSVELVHWNPRKRRVRGPIGRLLPKRPPTNNFGDLLGPIIVREILQRAGRSATVDVGAPRSHRLLTVGSVMRMARDGDVVWGTGVNGKSLDADYSFRHLDVRAVRGPLTRKFLLARGISVPEVFGDPGLLVGYLWPKATFEGRFEPQSLTVIPNLHDAPRYREQRGFWHPCSPVEDTIARIATSEFVIGSSLHAIILAESFGVPARLLTSEHEPAFKYQDYYLGSGRNGYRAADSVSDAIELGGGPPLQWSPRALLEAFPMDLWSI